MNASAESQNFGQLNGLRNSHVSVFPQHNRDTKIRQKYTFSSVSICEMGHCNIKATMCMGNAASKKNNAFSQATQNAN